MEPNHTWVSHGAVGTGVVPGDCSDQLVEGSLVPRLLALADRGRHCVAKRKSPGIGDRVGTGEARSGCQVLVKRGRGIREVLLGSGKGGARVVM